MSHLRIPLSRNPETTRRRKRVVWLIYAHAGLFILLLGALSYTYNRDTLYRATPESTNITMHFTPNQTTWPLLLQEFSDIPLVSNRALTLRDVSPYIEGEFTWFFLSNGERAFAMKCDDKHLPTSLFEQQSLVVQNPTSSIYLVSEKPVAMMQNPPRIQTWNPWRLLPFIDQLGSVSISHGATSSVGAILMHRDRIEWRFNKLGLPPLTWKNLPKNTVVALPTTTTSPDDLKKIMHVFDSFLKEFPNELSPNLVESLINGSRRVLLTYSEHHTGYLLEFTDTTLKEEERGLLIKTLAAIQRPTQEPWNLPDKTAATEFFARPADSTSNSLVLFGVEVHKVAGDIDTLYTAESNGTFIISNEESLVRFWLKPSADTESLSHSCPWNRGYIQTSILLKNAVQSKQLYESDLLLQISHLFPSIGLHETLFSTSISFCPSKKGYETE